jgi:hypothetical protein
VLVAVAMFMLFATSITLAAPREQSDQTAVQANNGGEEYVVQPGDWLSKISQIFYGDTSAWQIIVDATNEKAQSDSRFTVIDDPDSLEVGQLLWIPNLPAEDGEASVEETVAVTDTATGDAVTGTVSESVGVRFVEPLNGAVVSPTFNVVMEAVGLNVEPAGEIHEGAGHFHILVDTDFVPPGELLPFDEQYLHFGRGQLTTTLELEPGIHTLRLQFGNGAHMALEGEQYQDTITVTVSASGASALPPTGAPQTQPTPAAPASPVTSTAAISEQAPSPAVRFVAPVDGDVVVSPFEVTMAAEGLTVEPAGEIHEGSGHFHILLDTDFVPPGELLPFDEQHLHFGRGQLTTTVELEPGVHTLRLQFANGAHMALEGDEYRDEIMITVEAGD